MAVRYYKTYEFFDTEYAARSFCDNENKNPYIRRKHPASYTPWISADSEEYKFVAWYYARRFI